MKHTLTIFDDSGNLIDLVIMTSDKVGKSEGLWDIDNNFIYLGRERWDEWNDIMSDNVKQRLFLSQLKKVSKYFMN